MAAKTCLLYVCLGLYIQNKIYVQGQDKNMESMRQRRSSDSPVLSHVSKKYKVAANEVLYGDHHSFDLKPMARVAFSCKNSAYKLIMSDHPFAELRWKHNGQNLALQPNRMVGSLNSLTIQNVIPEDSGIYHCQISLSPQAHIVVAVYSLVVGDVVKHVYHGDVLHLKSNSFELGKLFVGSNRYWTNPQGEEMFRSSAKNEADDIITVNNGTAGKWLCRVHDETTDAKWLTARVEVIIDPPPTLWKRIRTYAKTNRTETVLILFAATFVFVLIVNCLTKIVEWKQKRFNKELDEIKKILKIDDENLAAENRPLLIVGDDNADDISVTGLPTNTETTDI